MNFSFFKYNFCSYYFYVFLISIIPMVYRKTAACLPPSQPVCQSGCRFICFSFEQHYPQNPWISSYRRIAIGVASFAASPQAGVPL